METWVAVFVIVAAVAIVVQMGILLAMYLQFRQLNERITRVTSELQSRLSPILLRLQILVEDVQPRLTGMVGDAAEITHLARGQALKVDRLFTEAVDRLRLQLIRVDQILTGAVESIEQTGADVRRTIAGPVHKASALIKGIQAGLEFFRASRHSPERAREHQEEGLFI